ncbi:MAG: Cyanate permease [uncultured archaeon A07HR60]|nr:MAG: Cyanate permease [uncultured archaeon A07HR60]
MTEWPNRGRAYALVIAGAVSYTCLLFVWFTLPAYLSVITADLGLSNTQAGLLAGAVPLTYVPLALFSGLAVDRLGPVGSLAAGLGVFGLAQVGRAYASGFFSMLLLTLLIGVGATAITFGLPKLVAVLFPSDETGLPSSLYLIGASAGTAGAFGLGRPVLGPLLGGWRQLFVWSGLVAVGYAAVWLALARLSGVETRSPTGDSALSPGSLRADIRAVLTHPQLRLVVLVGGTYLLVIHGLQGWLPTILESRGLSAARAGRTTTLLIGANVVGVLVIPGLADRYRARRVTIVGCGFVAATGIVSLIAGGVSALAGAGIVATGFGVGGLSALVRAIPPDLDAIGPGLTGAAIGLVFAVGEVGGFLGPVLIGSLYDLTGSFLPGLAMLAGGGVVAMGAGMAMRK